MAGYPLLLGVKPVKDSWLSQRAIEILTISMAPVQLRDVRISCYCRRIEPALGQYWPVVASEIGLGRCSIVQMRVLVMGGAVKTVQHSWEKGYVGTR